jgi:hypothetical protein
MVNEFMRIFATKEGDDLVAAIESGDLWAIFCGDRNWEDDRLIGSVMDILQPAVVIQGCAKGADTKSKWAADERGIKTLDFPARWDLYGRAAGPIRNTDMLDRLRAHDGAKIVVGFNNDIKKSKGTKDMLTQAKKAGILCLIVRENKPDPFGRIDVW